MAGFRTFATGEVLTAANVNNFLMKQSVMVFADATARTAALGAEVAEGMLTYNEDTAQLEVFDGSAFVPAGGGFDDVEVITATDASWPVPSLASPIVKVTAIGAGGGGGTGAQLGTGGATGGTTTFDAGGALVVTATGGAGGGPAASASVAVGPAGNAGFASQNGGGGGPNGQLNSAHGGGKNGLGGKVVSEYLDLTGITTVNVTIGAGGAAGTPDSFGQAAGAGGRGEVIVEYKAA